MDFKARLEQHLQAILARDLQTYSETLCRETPLTLVLPGGRIVEGAQATVKLHEAWFKETWTFSYEVLEVVEGPAYARAMLRIRIAESDGQGGESIHHAILALHFVLEQGTWRLTFDQNTVIP